MMKAEVLFGEGWEKAYREFETNQFFELAGKDYEAFSHSGYWSDSSPAPWLVTSMSWSDVNRRSVEFCFDRFEQVMMNFERMRSVGETKDEIAKRAKKCANFIKGILT